MSMMMGATKTGSKQIKAKCAPAKSKIIKSYIHDGRLYELHATKGWRSTTMKGVSA